MGKSNVFFTDLRANPRRNLLDKVETLIEKTSFADNIGNGDLVAVKLHFGELGNTAYIRPVFVRRVVEIIKKLGGKPFITDSNTLYVGSRSNAVSHLETAIANGFGYSSVGAPLVIADGLRGNSYIDIGVKGDHFESVSIASEIVNADALIALAHFKFHELSGIGGTVKNLAMGCAARQGKLSMHSSVSPKVKAKKCVACGLCIEWCAHGAITITEKARIDPDSCVGCGECIITCPHGAIQIRWTEGPQAMQEKMAEYAMGAVNGKKGKVAFLNFITQVSPACDCYGHNDAPIVPDVGFMSSIDPVAIDQASFDLVNKQQGIVGSALETNHSPGEDKVRGVYPKIDATVQLECAEKIGLGTRDYEIINVE